MTKALFELKTQLARYELALKSEDAFDYHNKAINILNDNSLYKVIRGYEEMYKIITFYANESNYNGFHLHDPETNFINVVDWDNGKKARKLLEEIE